MFRDERIDKRIKRNIRTTYLSFFRMGDPLIRKYLTEQRFYCIINIAFGVKKKKGGYVKKNNQIKQKSVCECLTGKFYR